MIYGSQPTCEIEFSRGFIFRRPGRSASETPDSNETCKEQWSISSLNSQYPFAGQRGGWQQQLQQRSRYTRYGPPKSIFTMSTTYTSAFDDSCLTIEQSERSEHIPDNMSVVCFRLQDSLPSELNVNKLRHVNASCAKKSDRTTWTDHIREKGKMALSYLSKMSRMTPNWKSAIVLLARSVP